MTAHSLAPTVYVEVDFPTVCMKKRTLIQDTPLLADVLGKYESGDDGSSAFIRNERYVLVGADLRDLPGLEAALRKAGVSFTVPTLFLSECVLVYMDAGPADALVQWIPRTFRRLQPCTR